MLTSGRWEQKQRGRSQGPRWSVFLVFKALRIGVLSFRSTLPSVPPMFPFSFKALGTWEVRRVQGEDIGVLDRIPMFPCGAHGGMMAYSKAVSR